MQGWKARLPFVAGAVALFGSLPAAVQSGQIALVAATAVTGLANLAALRFLERSPRLANAGVLLANGVLALLIGWVVWRGGSRALHYAWGFAGGFYFVAAVLISRSASSRPLRSRLAQRLRRQRAGATQAETDPETRPEPAPVPEARAGSDGPILRTARLRVRAATIADASFFHRLWTNPEVMRFVGFPHGLRITLEEIEARLRREAGERPASVPLVDRGLDHRLDRGLGCLLDRLLVVAREDIGETIGECFASRPDAEGIARTDVKLLPAHQGRRFGSELKEGLLDLLFRETDCRAVEATPNVENHASIRMQERVGGVCVGEAVHEFPKAMRSWTTPVRHYRYRVTREAWAARADRP